MKQRKDRLVDGCFRDVGEGLPEEVFEQRPEGGEGVLSGDAGQTKLGGGGSKCKGPGDRTV